MEFSLLNCPHCSGSLTDWLMNLIRRQQQIASKNSGFSTPPYAYLLTLPTNTSTTNGNTATTDHVLPDQKMISLVDDYQYPRKDLNNVYRYLNRRLLLRPPMRKGRRKAKRPYSCTRCPARFFTKRGLNLHHCVPVTPTVKLPHDPFTPVKVPTQCGIGHKCSLCGKVEIGEESFRNHIKLHSMEVPSVRQEHSITSSNNPTVIGRHSVSNLQCQVVLQGATVSSFLQHNEGEEENNEGKEERRAEEEEDMENDEQEEGEKEGDMEKDEQEEGEKEREKYMEKYEEEDEKRGVQKEKERCEEEMEEVAEEDEESVKDEEYQLEQKRREKEKQREDEEPVYVVDEQVKSSVNEEVAESEVEEGGGDKSIAEQQENNTMEEMIEEEEEGGRDIIFTCEVCGVVLKHYTSYMAHMNCHHNIQSPKASASPSSKTSFSSPSLSTPSSTRQRSHTTQPSKLGKYIQNLPFDGVLPQSSTPGRNGDSTTGVSSNVDHSLPPTPPHGDGEEEKRKYSYHYQCQMCTKSFKYERSLHTHIKAKHSNVEEGLTSETVYHCQYCNKSYKNERGFKQHVWYDHSQLPMTLTRLRSTEQWLKQTEPKEVQKESRGGAVTAAEETQKGASVNTSRQEKNRGGAAAAMTKGKASAQSKGVQDKEVGGGGRGVANKARCHCTKCDKSFSRKDTLRNHMWHVHKERRLAHTYDCHRCNKQYRTMDHWERHMWLVHKKEFPVDKKRYRCHNCDKSYTKKRHLDRHMSGEHPEEYAAATDQVCYHCPKCEQIYYTFTNLEMHKMYIHPELFLTDDAEYQTPDRHGTKRQEHQKGKKTAVKRSYYDCPECSKSFTSKSGRYKHLQHAHQNPLRVGSPTTNPQYKQTVETVGQQFQDMTRGHKPQTQEESHGSHREMTETEKMDEKDEEDSQNKTRRDKKMPPFSQTRRKLEYVQEEEEGETETEMAEEEVDEGKELDEEEIEGEEEEEEEEEVEVVVTEGEEDRIVQQYYARSPNIFSYYKQNRPVVMIEISSDDDEGDEDVVVDDDEEELLV